jgi:hydroxyacylglutathione hydrolase
MFFRQIFDEKLAQYAYLIGCQATGEAIVIDPERDIDQYVKIATAEGLEIVAVTETHIHADFLSGSREFAEQHGTHVYVSDEGDADWKYQWVKDGDYKYTLLKDGNTFKIGNIEIRAVHTPGHTPEHLSFLVTDLGGGANEPMGMATGDFVFVGDLGRPDLLESAAGVAGAMEPSARTLHSSVNDFLGLPDYMQIWPGHGAGSACGKALGAVPETTVGYERRFNAAIQFALEGEDEFVSYILAGQPEPPMYFARMKRDNKIGPAVLGGLPQPQLLTAKELVKLSGRTDIAVLDTRLDRTAFMAGHLPGSIFAPLNKTFPTIAGSYVEESTPIYLVVEEKDVMEAVRSLIRIGLDNVVGYATPDTLLVYDETHGKLHNIEEVKFDSVKTHGSLGDVEVLDVRGAAEFEEGHVPNALNLAHTRLYLRHDELPKERKLLIHCGTGARAASAASLLSRLGFTVSLVNDEWANWAQMGDVVIGSKALEATA